MTTAGRVEGLEAFELALGDLRSLGAAACTISLKLRTYDLTRDGVAIQVEGQVRGMQSIEERFVLVRANSSDQAERRLAPVWKKYAKPYVIHPALKDGALWRTTWNTKLHHFPASTGALGRRSLHRQSRAIRTAFQNFGSVEVGMVDVATVRTTEVLLVARFGVDRSASRAGLRAVSRLDFDQTTATPGELVAQKLDQMAPSGVGNSTRERAVQEHVGGLKALDSDRAVTLGIGGGERMQDVVALAANLSMQPGHAIHCLLPIVGSFLASGHHTLNFRQALQRGLQGFGIFDESAVRISDQVSDAAVESDNRFGARRRIRKLDFAHDRGKPLVPVTANRTAFRLAFERPVHHRAHVARSCAQTLRGTSARKGSSAQSGFSSLIWSKAFG